LFLREAGHPAGSYRNRTHPAFSDKAEIGLPLENAEKLTTEEKAGPDLSEAGIEHEGI
jgi:hypothetical protein